MTAQLTSTWVLDVHLDTATRAVRLTATDRAAKAVHIEPLELLTVAAVRAAVERLISRHGRPHDIATDDSALWSGLGSAIGVPQWHPVRTGNLAWLQRLVKAVAR